MIDPTESSEEDEPSMTEEQIIQEGQNGLQLKRQFRIADEQCVAMNKSYILHLANNKSWNAVAAVSSDQNVHMFDFTPGGLVRRKQPIGEKLPKQIIGARFANGDDNILYVATRDGTIHAFDLRDNRPASQYKDTSLDQQKNVISFDLNANDRVLCAGTQPVGPDTFMLFFDTRKGCSMGAYFESHSDDITQIAFHPTQPDTLATGSLDGLINVFDISKSNETDALEYCMNTESSVQRLQWHVGAGKSSNGAVKTESDDEDDDDSTPFDRDMLSCITCVEKLQLYDVADSEMIYEQQKGNFVGVHSTETAGQIFALRAPMAWSKLLNGVTLSPVQKDKLTMSSEDCSNFVDNKQMIRCSLFKADSQQVITGGEGGLVTVWSPGLTEEKPKPMELKKRTKDRNRKHKAKPY